MTRKKKDPMVNVVLLPAFAQHVIALLDKIKEGAPLNNQDRDVADGTYGAVKDAIVRFMRGI